MPSPPYISPPPPSSSHHDGTLSVGVATGPSPTGPFRDLGAPLVHTPGMGNIDASFFRDTDGKDYLIWKRDGNGATPPVPTPVFVQRIIHGGLLLAGEPHVAASVRGAAGRRRWSPRRGLRRSSLTPFHCDRTH